MLPKHVHLNILCVILNKLFFYILHLISAQTNIYNEQGDKTGIVTSGCPSPSLKQNVAMGYVGIADAEPGTRLLLEVRGKRIPGTVTKLPFVPHNYFTPKKAKAMKT